MLYFLLHELDCVHRLWGKYIDELIQLKALTTIGPQPLAAGSYYLLSDLLYRSAVLTNSFAGIVEGYDTDAYGNTLLFSGSGTMGWFDNDDAPASYSACRYAFMGREYDAETRSVSFRARCYSTALGRFLSRDPSDYADGPNMYQFVGSDPASNTDPLGAKTCPCPAGTVDLRVSAGDISASNLDKALGEESIAGFVRDVAATIPEGKCVRKLIIVAHGNQLTLTLGKNSAHYVDQGNSKDQNVTQNNVLLFAKDLNSVICFCAPCEIFLLSCNTGLGGWVQTIADETGCTIYAPEGFCFPDASDPLSSKLLVSNQSSFQPGQLLTSPKGAKVAWRKFDPHQAPTEFPGTPAPASQAVPKKPKQPTTAPS